MLLVAYQDPCDWGATYMKTWPVLGPVIILEAGLGQSRYMTKPRLNFPQAAFRFGNKGTCHSKGQCLSPNESRKISRSQFSIVRRLLHSNPFSAECCQRCGLKGLSQLAGRFSVGDCNGRIYPVQDGLLKADMPQRAWQIMSIGTFAQAATSIW
ncbi:hypothetical protein N7G274_009569 [Stereocaulon virgatum]|uniref:Uncharacterized protein n=1 Tax=Stereocaulon virgatum TaxID=373712 RepID=A0ABR3ZYL9_9LECA